AVQALDFVERQTGAGRIVRIGEEDEFRLLSHRGQNRVDIGGVTLLRRDDGFSARTERYNRVDQEAVGGVNRLVAVDEIGMRQKVEQIVRARAADDAVGIEAEGPP